MIKKIAKYTIHDPELVDNYEREVLTILAEECAEVIKCVTKILRFGKKDHYPNRPSPNNTESLGREIGDILYMVDMCMNAQLINLTDRDSGFLHKKSQIQKYFQNIP